MDYPVDRNYISDASVMTSTNRSRILLTMVRQQDEIIDIDIMNDNDSHI